VRRVSAAEIETAVVDQLRALLRQPEIIVDSAHGHDELPGLSAFFPGLSAFFKDGDGAVFHTYSAYARGLEELIGTLMILDRAPLGRNERTTMDFVHRQDEYEDAPSAPSCCGAEM
jgi:predicted dithiol-disulfide oxidoreductase (DUF899 family)